MLKFMNQRIKHPFRKLTYTSSLALIAWALGPGSALEFVRVSANGGKGHIVTAIAVAQAAPSEFNGLKQTDSATEQPVVPPLPEEIPNSVEPSPNGIVGLSPGPDDEIGIGHLRPQDLSSLDGEDWIDSSILNAKWLRGIALPIYVGPGADHWGWLLNGWLIPNGSEPIAVGRDATFAMVQPRRGLYTFPVMEIRDDGWFRFQYTPAGTAWAHLSQLDLGQNTLVVETWPDWMGEVGRVNFRKHGASQPLRPEPTTSASLQSLVGPNSLIEPLEIRDDWMRVRVTQPANGCQALPGASTEEGWMRWQDNDALPLIWFPTDGC